MQCNFSLWEFPCVSDSKVTPQAVLAIAKPLKKRDGTNCHLWLLRTKVSSAQRNQHNSQLLRKPVRISPPGWQKPWVVWWRLSPSSVQNSRQSSPIKNTTLWLTKLKNLLNYERPVVLIILKIHASDTQQDHWYIQCIQLITAYFPTPQKRPTSEDT